MINWDYIKQRLVSGLPICIYDFPDRENETDVVYIGYKTSPLDVDFIRREVGGPLAVYLSAGFMQKLGVSTYREFVQNSNASSFLKSLTKPNKSHDPRFAITIDARDNETGCSPVESSHTIQVLHELALSYAYMEILKLQEEFGRKFISPGHIPLIRAADNLLQDRKGHAELALTIAKFLELPDIIVAGELVDPITLRSMERERAEDFARFRNIPFITGEEIISKA